MDKSKHETNIKNVAKKIESTTKKQAQNITNATKNIGSTIDSVAKQVMKNTKKAKNDLKEKYEENKSLDDELTKAISIYNNEYNILNDLGISLFYQREKTIDLIENVENLINSIANHPKKFDKEICEIQIIKNDFKQVCDFTKKELEQAQRSAISAGVGVTSGMAIASLAPSAAMWVATTFGTASTGTAISVLSGAAANSAALAWLGGGTLATGGSGIAGGTAFLAMAGPIGWGVAGATLLTSIVIFANNKKKIYREKFNEIQQVKNNITNVKETSIKLKILLEETKTLYANLISNYRNALYVFNSDYVMLDEKEKKLLGSIVNETKAIAKLIEKGIN